MEKLSPVPRSRKEERKKYLRACLLSGVPGELKSLVSMALSALGGELAQKGSSSSEQY